MNNGEQTNYSASNTVEPGSIDYRLLAESRYEEIARLQLRCGRAEKELLDWRDGKLERRHVATERNDLILENAKMKQVVRDVSEAFEIILTLLRNQSNAVEGGYIDSITTYDYRQNIIKEQRRAIDILNRTVL